MNRFFENSAKIDNWKKLRPICLPTFRFDRGHSFTRGVKIGPYFAAHPQYLLSPEYPSPLGCGTRRARKEQKWEQSHHSLEIGWSKLFVLISHYLYNHRYSQLWVNGSVERKKQILVFDFFGMNYECFREVKYVKLVSIAHWQISRSPLGTIGSTSCPLIIDLFLLFFHSYEVFTSNLKIWNIFIKSMQRIHCLIHFKTDALQYIIDNRSKFYQNNILFYLYFRPCTRRAVWYSSATKAF